MKKFLLSILCGVLTFPITVLSYWWMALLWFPLVVPGLVPSYLQVMAVVGLFNALMLPFVMMRGKPINPEGTAMKLQDGAIMTLSVAFTVALCGTGDYVLFVWLRL